MIPRDAVICIAESCGAPTGDRQLDELFDEYGRASSRVDSPVYYRFLYGLGQAFHEPRLVELGCKSGAASLHFLKGGGRSAIGIDHADSVRWDLFAGLDFTFRRQSSVDVEASRSVGATDIVFIDTDHQYATTAEEFRIWEPKVKSGGLVLFDDILEPEYGCSRFWHQLKGDKVAFERLHPLGWGFGIYFKP